MKNWQKLLLFAVPTVFIGFLIIIFILFFLGPQVDTISSHSSKFLTLPLYGNILDDSRGDTFSNLFQDSKPTLLKYILGIRRAKHDKSIKGIIIRPFDLQIGYAKIEELRAALLDFRKSGKQIVAFLEFASTRDFYLASTCNKIFMVPNGTLAFLGLNAEATYIKDALQKLGIEAEFLHVGKYKTAAEQYTNNQMSEQHREMMTRLIDDLYQHMLGEIAQTHPDSSANLKAMIDIGLLSAKQAQQNHLIDSLLYWDELEDFLDSGKSHFSATDFSQYLESNATNSMISSSNKIALLVADGAIYSGTSGYSPVSGNVLGSETLIREIRDASNDESIKAIVMRIDSPGGSGLASDLIWREVQNARAKKPFVISMSDVAASGGYYIAMAADKIVAHPMTITGSIGVLSGKFNLKGLYNKIGVRKEEISRGRHAGLYSDNRNFSQEERKIVQGNLQEFYTNFTQKAAEGRKMSPEEIEKVAQGQVWSGIRAKELGLVDTLGTLVTAVRIAQKMANIPPNRSVKIWIQPRRVSLLERILEKQITRQMVELVPFLREEFFKTQENWKFFKSGEVLSLLPCDMKIK